MMRTLTVASGDTMGKIATRFYGSATYYKKLADYNGINNSDMIVRGQVLYLPPRFMLEDVQPVQTRQESGIVCPHGLEEIRKAFGDIYKFIGVDGNLRHSWETEYLGRIRLPFSIPLSWDRSSVVRNLYCHKEMKPVFKSVFETIEKRRLEGNIVSFGGCFNYRSVRIGTKLSTHSWGIAIDLNPETNRMGTVGDMDPRVVRVFEEHGFVWGGSWPGRKDPMHFQFCDGY